MLKTLKGYGKAKKILKEEKPDIVIGTGGFIVLITVFVLFIIIRVVQLLCCKIKCC